MDAHRCIGLDETAARLGLCRRSVYSLHYRGELPFVKLGRRVVVRERDVEALIARSVSAPSAEQANGG